MTNPKIDRLMREAEEAVGRLMAAIVEGTLDAVEGQPITRCLPSMTGDTIYQRIRQVREKVTGSAEADDAPQAA